MNLTKTSVALGLLVGATFAACETGNEGVGGEWVYSDDRLGSTTTYRITIDTDDAGEVSDCSYGYSSVTEYSETRRSGSCEVQERSDGTIAVAVKLKKATYEDLEGYGGEGGGPSGPEDRLSDMTKDERNFTFECHVAVEEEELECQRDGGNYYEFEKD